MYEVYGTINCSFCEKAVNLLKLNRLPYIYISIDGITEKQFKEQFGELESKTVPKIYLKESGYDLQIGGYEDLETHIENLDHNEFMTNYFWRV